MSLEETMAEKVRALLYSKHARHLYDIHFLSLHGVAINPDLVKKKCRIVYGEFDISKLNPRIAEKRKVWIQELRPFVYGTIPAFDDVADHVSGLIRDAMV